MIESASVAIGSGIGAGVATCAFLLAKLFRRNGRARDGVPVEKVRRELHNRMNDEVGKLKEDFVLKEVCTLVSGQLQKDMGEIKQGVDTLKTDVSKTNRGVGRLLKHVLGEDA